MMGFTYGYAHNTLYGAADFSAAIARLTTGGVLPLPITVTAGTESLTAAIATGGTIGDGLKPSYSGGIVTISAGQGIFGDGGWVCVDDGALVSAQNGDVVYFIRDAATGIVSLMSGEAPDKSNNILVIASISGGELVDERSFATSRLAPNSQNIYKGVSVSFSSAEIVTGNSKTVSLTNVVNNNILIITVDSNSSLGYGLEFYHTVRSAEGNKVYDYYSRQCCRDFRQEGVSYISIYANGDSNNKTYIGTLTVYLNSDSLVFEWYSVTGSNKPDIQLVGMVM